MIAVATVAALALPVTAQQPSADRASQPGTAALVEGEVRKVDKETRKLTIKHGPIASLDMPAMTMVFQVKDPAMLDQVRAGDRIRFQAEKVDGAYRVTRIEQAR